jgi:serine/threonine protein kinase
MRSSGEGGKGEVYRARDPKLRRDVAIKVRPSLLLIESIRSGATIRRSSPGPVDRSAHGIGRGLIGQDNDHDAHQILSDLRRGNALDREPVEQ